MNNQEPIISETPITEPALLDFKIIPKPPQNNIFKIIFIFSLIIFILVASAFIYYKNRKNSPTIKNSSSVVSPTKTSFQKMITDWDSYKELTDSKRTHFDTYGSFWASFIKPGDENYDLAQKIIKGDIKELVIDKNNFPSILEKYVAFTFYLTPNYENWTNDQFKSDLIQITGRADFSPVYAYPDKLIWTDTLNCGKTGPDDTVYRQRVLNQCNDLVKEIDGAFL